ncbi:MAG: SDR family NAD(P)-dependent oxidoreductase [Phycisphaerae bacterium]|jgi:short-subunit dehydrogenase
MRRQIKDKTIIITGASAGIGAATALACADEGLNLVLNARREDRLRAVADQVAQRGRPVELVVGDVTEPGLSERLLDAAQARFGRFDIVLANAGYGLSRPIHELAEADLRRIFDVNFFSATALLREAARRLLAERRRGHLLMTSSSISKFTLPEFAAYSSTKAAQNHVCRAMHMELRRHGIDVSSVHPITTTTEFFDVAAELSGRPASEAGPAHRVPRFFRQTPEQVARAIIACLRRPKVEVWTSTTVRILCGVVTVFPSLLDVLVGVRPR